jgi:hypothetical protein
VSGRRWPLVIAAVVAAVVIAGAAWAAGRASAPDAPTASDEPAAAAATSAIQTMDGVPVGVDHSRAGALAAADNYAATTVESVVQNPGRYRQLVEQAFAPAYQAQALSEAEDVRSRSPRSVAIYAEGGRGIAAVGARRLDTYEEARASVTTWVAYVRWGPELPPEQEWQLVESDLRWVDGRWRVTSIRTASRPAPSPTRVRYSSDDALKSSTFERELRGMTAPIYGTGG